MTSCIPDSGETVSPGKPYDEVRNIGRRGLNLVPWKAHHLRQSVNTLFRCWHVATGTRRTLSDHSDGREGVTDHAPGPAIQEPDLRPSSIGDAAPVADHVRLSV